MQYRRVQGTSRVENCRIWESMGRHSRWHLNLGHYAQHKKQELSPDSDKENVRFIIIEIIKIYLIYN